MKNLHASLLAAGALGLACTAPMAATYSFQAMLDAAQELGSVSSAGSGNALLVYDDLGTASAADDKYSFTMFVSGLTGPATGYHIHGAAAPGETGPVRVDLTAAPFISLPVGGSLLAGGNDVAVPAIMATPSSATNPGYPAMSFLDMLKDGLAYVNVHTAAFPNGEVRGQFMQQVTAVPEPGTWAMLLAGVAAIGAVVRRRVNDQR